MADRAGSPPGTRGGREGLPYTILSCCMSIDGYISAASGIRLLLSNDADLDRVDAERAACDAILVGAQTVRADNPRLLVRDGRRVAGRRAQGMPEQPLKATVTATADLDPAGAFFTTGQGRIVYCTSAVAARARGRLAPAADIVDAGDPVRMRAVSADLGRRGVRRLLVEGGARIHTQFLAEDIADELQLAIAPMLVGDSAARRFVGDAGFPWHPGRRGHLAEARQVGDVAVLTYALSERFHDVHAPGRA